jgi:hypothetical protein
MVWQCIGPQQQVKSRTRQISTATNQISDETKPVDYSPAFKLENNRKNKTIVSFSFEIKRFSSYERYLSSTCSTFSMQRND